MKGPRRRFLSPGRIGLCLQLFSSLALAQNYKPPNICASINTGEGEAEFWTWQSFGHCGDICRDKYAFAVVQDHLCWCSDFAPDDSQVVDIDKCGTKCPGFDELCGGNNVYGYVRLDKPISGTKDVGGSASAPTKVQTVTADGTVRTVTITPTAGVETPNTADIKSQKKGGPSTGTIVGIVVGVALGIIALFAIGCFFKIRRAHQRNEEGTFEVRSAGSVGAGVSAPGMSQMKGNGPFTTTRGIIPASGVGPAAAGGAAAGAGAAVANRRSRLMPIDPRMDPATAPGLYVRNKSHESVHTLHDDQDYSRRVVPPRVLRATNPDPDDE